MLTEYGGIHTMQQKLLELGLSHGTLHGLSSDENSATLSASHDHFNSIAAFLLFKFEPELQILCNDATKSQQPQMLLQIASMLGLMDALSTNLFEDSGIPSERQIFLSRLISMVEVVTSATTELDSVVAEGETGDESIEVIGKLTNVKGIDDQFARGCTLLDLICETQLSAVFSPDCKELGQDLGGDRIEGFTPETAEKLRNQLKEHENALVQLTKHLNELKEVHDSKAMDIFSPGFTQKMETLARGITKQVGSLTDLYLAEIHPWVLHDIPNITTGLSRSVDGACRQNSDLRTVLQDFEEISERHQSMVRNLSSFLTHRESPAVECDHEPDPSRRVHNLLARLRKSLDVFQTTI